MGDALQYVYQRERREFGKQCMFSDKKFLMCSIPSNHDEFKDYILKDPVEDSTQLGKQYALSEVNTERTDFESKGINHTEGGWPKDINYLDSEQTVRYRRKLEKDDTYITQVLRLSEKIDRCITQNNAVNIYETYFDNLEPAPLVDRSSSRTMFVYKDVETPARPISHMSWSPDGGSKLAITYCNLDFQKNTADLSPNSYIWETENPNQPLFALKPKCSSICLEYNPKDINVLVSGQYNGQLHAWDTRVGNEPVGVTPKEICHRESVSSVLWINSKSGTEFFSGGADGQVIWWDTRKLNERLDQLFMDPEKTDEQLLERSYGISVLEYETTIPTRFMVGTEQGVLFSCNRKGKTPTEKISLRMQCHSGPICTLVRNPSFFKNFLTVGDWNARIWSEDCKESAVMWTKYCSVELTDGCWSPTKCSLFYLSRTDGILEAWDLLQQQSEPILSMKVCDDSIKCVKPHECGRMIACGSAKGHVYLVEVSDNMAYCAKNDKAILTAMLDRESKRERILEGKLREIKLKQKAQEKQAAEQLRIKEEMLTNPEQAGADSKEGFKVKKSLSHAAIQQAEDEFFQSIDQEKQRRIKEQKKESSDKHHKKSKRKKEQNGTGNGHVDVDNPEAEEHEPDHDTDEEQHEELENDEDENEKKEGEEEEAQTQNGS